MIEQDEQQMTEQVEQEARRPLLTAEIEYLTEEIGQRIALLVWRAQELEAMDAEREGREYRGKYAEVSERTDWSLELRAEPLSRDFQRGEWQQSPLWAANEFVEPPEHPASGTTYTDPPCDGRGV
jgi:hypothetical protein